MKRLIIILILILSKWVLFGLHSFPLNTICLNLSQLNAHLHPYRLTHRHNTHSTPDYSIVSGNRLIRTLSKLSVEIHFEINQIPFCVCGGGYPFAGQQKWRSCKETIESFSIKSKSFSFKCNFCWQILLPNLFQSNVHSECKFISFVSFFLSFIRSME